MRIIGGYLKGRVLHPQGKFSARPTTDFAKEGLFNVLTSHIDLDGANVLDLFAGTGNITLEFVSRGVKEITSVEIEQECINNIFKFSKELNIENIKVVRTDIFKWLQKPKDIAFDVVFADPPYAHKKLTSLPESIVKSGLLKSGGWMIVEHGKEIDFSEYPFFVFKRTYGNVNFSFFEYKSQE